jgi:NADH-quinone oxidoreductase subunit A
LSGWDGTCAYMLGEPHASLASPTRGSSGRMNALHTSVDRPDMLWPLVVYVAMVMALVTGMLVLSWLSGQRHADRATGEPYESGINPTGSARLRLSADFYLIAMFFVIFDLEAVFIFAWAVAAREVGWVGYIGVVIFIGVLVAALLYEWRMGTLDWRAHPQQGRSWSMRAVPFMSHDGSGAAEREKT